jgi:acetyl esterase/lipase
MRRFVQRGIVAVAALLVSAMAIRADEAQPYTRTRDVIYGRKFGMALTLDVFTPTANPNGIGIIAVASGGWFSRVGLINPGFYAPFLQRGYTVFAVVHGSQPKFTIPEIIEDMNRSVRFIRYHAKDYHIDPERLGIVGASAGGHLSLMQGMAGEMGDPDAPDPVDRVSSRVQAVAAFFPPTDLLNYGEKGREMLARSFQKPFTAAVDYRVFDDEKKLYVPVTDEKEQREISRRISPITHVSSDDPPTLLFHGDKDDLVPLQQSEEMLAKLKEAGVTAQLIVRKGEGHGWKTIPRDLALCADWFDKYLLHEKTAGSVKEKKSEPATSKGQ